MSLGSRLHVIFDEGLERSKLSLPRCYTLTHSDVTGELYLTVARDYNLKQIRGWFTRFMRDEVLGEWSQEGNEYSLHLYCHVSGGLVFGTSGMRYNIFQQHMPLVLQAFYEGDNGLYEKSPELRNTKVFIHFAAWQKRYSKTELWGSIGQY